MTPAASTAKRPRKLLRRLAKGLLGLLLLGTILGAGAAALLATDLPRRWALGLAERATGLEISLQELEIGLLGRSRLEGLRVTLPGSERPILRVDALAVTHAAVPAMAWRGLGLERLRLEAPRLRLVRDELGVWNAQELAAMLPRGEQESGPTSLPAIRVRDARATIVRPATDPQRIGPLALRGAARPDGSWGLELSLDGDAARLVGALAPSRGWRQTLDLRAGAEAFAGLGLAWLGPVDLEATWRGRIGPAGPEGRLRISSGRVGPLRVRGDLELASSGPGPVLRPAGLTVASAGEGFAWPPIELVGGALRYTDGAVAVSDLEARAGPVDVTAEGSVDPTALTGRLELRHHGAYGDTEHRGALEIATRPAPPGRRRLAITSRLTVEGPFGRIQARGSAELTTEGPRLTGKIELADLLWRKGRRGIELGDIAARLRLNEEGIRLRTRDVDADPGVRVSGDLAWDTADWHVRARAAGLRLRGPDARRLRGELAAHGTGAAVRLERGVLAVTAAEGEPAIGELRVSASGRYRPGVGREGVPIRARIALACTGTAGSDASAPLGRWRIETDVEGTPRPLALHFDGTLAADALPPEVASWMGPVDGVRTRLRGTVDAQGASFESGGFELLGSVTRISGHLGVGGPRMTAELEALEAAAIPALGASAGRVDASVTALMPQWRPEGLSVAGEWSANALRIGPLVADRASGKLAVRDGRLRLDPVRLERGDATVEGVVSVGRPPARRVTARVRMRRWPLDLRGGAVAVRASGRLHANFDGRAATADGALELRETSLAVRGVPILDLASARFALAERDLVVEGVDGVFLGGRIEEARGRIDAADWTRSRLRFEWRDAEPGRMGAWHPVLEPLAGRVSGRLRVAPSEDPHAREPCRIELRLRRDGLRYRRLDIEPGRFVILAGPERVVLQQGPLAIAGGEIELWGRLRRRSPRPFALVQARLTELAIPPILRAVAPADPPDVEGVLSGRVTVSGPVFDRERLGGDASLSLERADLGKAPGFTLLYNTLSFQLGDEPIGHGQLSARLEGPSLELQRLHYFNRGLEVNGQGRIADVWRGGASPVEGRVLGVLAPLRDTRLPGAELLTGLLQAAQGEAALVRIEGRLSEPAARLRPFSDVGQALGDILGGD